MTDNQIVKSRKYKISYVKSTGEKGVYTISSPIEKFDWGFSAYCFNRNGIRTFNYTGVSKIRKTLTS